MKVERINEDGTAHGDLHARAARHAALAEPLRIRITDLLTLSDLSSTELRTEIGIRSNLLAHHLNVLEGAGMVTRRRSDGDRRRCYSTLTLEARNTAVLSLAQARSAHGNGPRRVVFICTGNSARSPFAAARWNAELQEELGVRAVSAGTFPASAPSTQSVEAAATFGVDLSAHRPRPVGELEAHDLLVIVCDRAYEELSTRFPLPTPRPRHWSVPDPGPSGSAAAYESCFGDIDLRVKDLGSTVKF
ncbi:arsenate reductase/protein-tyrosine-phosphatase family protein [Nesterenkonia haasae]|uniref:arsenate reductase/protein-tyrosine-phosphatase family protein n=1 Tax=Nesterenkonia haasae TaxID=2587813 RepID=UPI0013911567|nr:helix-turn-helix domain-containing protein [Nesterenkonia haasae]NDK31599.1 helix-turn-helix domain-containing protein [Nesterenkonia haasae]